MLQITPEPIINYLQGFHPESLLILSLIICYAAIIIFAKYWQDTGIAIYTSIAIIACNLQVLKAFTFSWYNEPIALGTITYASTFLASDAMTELYGADKARKSVFLSFASSILLLLFILSNLGFSPLINPAPVHEHFNHAHNALLTIFNPNMAIVVASFTAYIISQLTDIYIFSKLKQKTHNSKLWLRTLIAVMISSLIDSVIFNILAWNIFSPDPVPFKNLILTYILGGYILQMIVALFNIPAFYLLLKIVKR